MLTPIQLEQALLALLPMRVLLDDDDPDRYLWIDQASAVATTAEGIRLNTSARLQWDVIGIKVPVEIRQVALTVVPSIQVREGRDALVLLLRLDTADVSALPEFVESTLLKRVNEELSKEAAQVVWAFARTLDFNFALPKRIVDAPRVRLFAHQGAVKMSDEAIVLAAHFRVEVQPSAGAAADRATPDGAVSSTDRRDATTP